MRRIPRWSMVLALGLVVPASSLQAADPVVDSFVAQPASVAPGAETTLTIEAHDPDCQSSCSSGCGQYIRADLTSWSATGGSFTATDTGTSGSPYAATATWRAPAAEGTYTITVELADSGTFMCGGRQTTTVSLQIQVTANPNGPPVIHALAADPARILPGGTSALTASVSDPDGDAVTLTWATDFGTIVRTGATTAELTAPAAPGLATVTCTADDGNGGTATATVAVPVSEAVFERTIGAGLRTPHRVAAGPHGALYVADDGLGGIAVVGLASGEVVTVLPVGPVKDLDVDWNGDLLIAATAGARVIDRLGHTLLELDPGFTPAHPAAVTADTSSQRYAVLYRDSGRAVVFDGSGTVLFAFGGNGSQPGELTGASDIDAIAGGGFLIADTASGRILRYDSAGRFVGEFGSRGGQTGQFGELQGLAATAGGVVFATDAFQDRLQAFTLDGHLLDVLGTYGDGNGEVKTPIGVATAEDAGRLIVTSTNASKLQVFKLADRALAAPVAGANPKVLAFGSVPVGAVSSPRSVVLSNGGSVPLELFGVSATGDFQVSGQCPWELAPGQSCTLSVSFAPSAPGPREGRVLFRTDAPGSPQEVELTGSATVSGSGDPLVLPASLDFGTQEVGRASTTRVINVRNVGLGPTSVLNAVATGAFDVVATTCAGAVAPGGVCSVSLVFRPVASGPAAGTLQIDFANPPASATVALAGTGTVSGPQVTISETWIRFGDVAPGASSPSQTLTVTNTGAGSLSIRSLSLAGRNPGDFTLVEDDCSGRDLTPGASCQVSAVFNPTAQGVRSASLLIPTDAPSSPDTVVFQGTGAAAAAIPALTPAGAALLIALLVILGTCEIWRREVNR